MIGSGTAGRGYQIGPTLHATAGIFNCPMGRGGKEAGRVGEKSASTQLSQQFMPELKTGNNSWRENGLMTGVSVLTPLTPAFKFSHDPSHPSPFQRKQTELTA